MLHVISNFKLRTVVELSGMVFDGSKWLWNHGILSLMLFPVCVVKLNAEVQVLIQVLYKILLRLQSSRTACKRITSTAWERKHVEQSASQNVIEKVQSLTNAIEFLIDQVEKQLFSVDSTYYCATILPEVLAINRSGGVGRPRRILNLTQIEKTKDKIAEARGGVLFVDEAYRLIPTAGGKDFGREAIEELMSVMEKGDPVMIFAGYEKMMAKFLKVNMGLQSRIYRKFVFPDYTVEELGKIFRQRVKEKQYNLAADVNVETIIQEYRKTPQSGRGL